MKGRFVGQEKARLIRQSTGNGHSLLLSPGEHGRQVSLPLGDTKIFEQLHGSTASSTRTVATQFERDLDIFTGRQERNQV